VGARFRAPEQPEWWPQERQAHKPPSLAQMVLPQPAVAGQRWTLVTGVVADFVAVFLTFVVASHFCLAVRHNLSWLARAPEVPPVRLGFVLLYGALITLLGYSEGLYRTDLIRDSQEELWIVVRSVGWATLLAAATVHLFGIRGVIPLAAVAGSAALNLLCMLTWRKSQRLRAARRVQNGQATRNVLIVGAGSLGREVATFLEQNPHLGRVVRGFLDDDRTLDPDVLGKVDDLTSIAHAEFADEVILTAPKDRGVAGRVIQQAQRIHLDVKLIPDLLGFEPQSSLPENFGELPVLTLYAEPLPAAGMFLKRAFDLIGSALGLAILTPVLGSIALIIRLESPGPVLYRAPRVGRKGRCFLCYKFRTMITNADGLKERLRAQNQRQGPTFKIENDPRITRAGRFLRRYSLDEMPQLWNVLKGEMSLVVPRPHPMDDFARYELDHLVRLDVTPGITGLWQVTARQDPSFLRNLALDQEYIDQWSLWMDARILFRTVFAVVLGSGT
jgi:exopolysaccharide biosynthesis polyprenyl glycosylphosphotransferase